MVRSAVLACLITASAAMCQADENKPVAAVGKPAPDFTVTGIDDKEFSLKDKLKKGDRNVVLIFSRANW